MMSLVGQYVIPFLAAIIAAFSIWFAAKTKGEANEKVKAADQRTTDQEAAKVNELKRIEIQTQAEVKSVGVAHESSTEVNAMSDADVLSELHRDYSKE